ncbi:MAG: hypothetical protein QOI53_2176 [Verrucomicrobiota bacterium]|nr:hypothetical protein [Verrucomicrobiota bacterium]
MNGTNAPGAPGISNTEASESQAGQIRKGLGEVFLAALSDPKTAGLILNTDGTLWQERAMEWGNWSVVGKIDPGFTATLISTAARCLPPTYPLREVRLDRPRSALPVKPVEGSLACACCRPTPLAEAPMPLFRLCWKRVGLIRRFLRNAERDDARLQLAD